MHIEGLKRSFACSVNKYFQFSNNIIVIPLSYQKIRLELKNNVVYVAMYVALSYHVIHNCGFDYSHFAILCTHNHGMLQCL